MLCLQIANLSSGNGNTNFDSRITPSGRVRVVKEEAHVPKAGVESIPLVCVCWRMDGLGFFVFFFSFLFFHPPAPPWAESGFRKVFFGISFSAHVCSDILTGVMHRDRFYMDGSGEDSYQEYFSRHLPVFFIIPWKMFKKASSVSGCVYIS